MRMGGAVRVGAAGGGCCAAAAQLRRASDPTEPAQAHCQTPWPASLDRQLTAVDQTVGAQQARHPLHRLQTRITLHMAVLCNASASHTHHVQTGGSRHSQGTGSTHRLLSKSFCYACGPPAASAARRCRAASRGGASPAASASAATRAPSVSEAGPAKETSRATQCCAAGSAAAVAHPAAAAAAACMRLRSSRSRCTVPSCRRHTCLQGKTALVTPSTHRTAPCAAGAATAAAGGRARPRLPHPPASAAAPHQTAGRNTDYNKQ